MDSLITYYMRVTSLLQCAIWDGDLDKIALHSTQMQDICRQAIQLVGQIKVAKPAPTGARLAALDAMASRK